MYGNRAFTEAIKLTEISVGLVRVNGALVTGKAHFAMQDGHDTDRRQDTGKTTGAT